MKTKFLLPVLAMIFAVGMSFTTVNTSTEDYAIKYVNDGTSWHQIDVNCEQGINMCKVIFAEDPSKTPYQVYNTQNLEDPALGTARYKLVPGPAPSN